MAFFRAVIHPIFQMVPVAPFVMQPGRRIAFVFALLVVWTVVTGVIFCAEQKLGGRIFGKVMQQSLPVKPQPETALQHQPFVTCDGFEMLDRMQ